MKSIRLIKNNISKNFMIAVCSLIGIFIFFLIFSLFYKSKDIIIMIPFKDIFLSTDWYPYKNKFGLLPFIISSLYISGIAIIISVPLCLLSSIFLVEYCPEKIKKILLSFIDILAGIPSVLYGVWGIIVIVPLVKNYLAKIFHVNTTGYSLITGGIVLSAMILPFIIQMSCEILNCIPNGLKEASYAVGATKWQTIKYVVIKKSFPGIIASFILGFSRAIGETMAVMMVAGNVSKIPDSIFSPCYPLPALIANNYGEMLSIPLYESAIMLASLVLLITILIFNILVRIILSRIEKAIIR